MRCLAGLAALAVLLIGGPARAAVKLQMIQGHPVVHGVYVNGHGPYSFLLDTGTTANQLEPKLAAAIGLKPAFRSELVSPAGVVYAPGTDGVEVRFDSVRAVGQRFLFTPIEPILQITPGVQGVLGQTFLSRFDYLLNLRRKQIEFGKRPPAPAAVRAPLRDDARPVVSTSLGELVLDSGTRWVTLFGVQATRAIEGEVRTMAGSLRIGTVTRRLLIGGRAFWSGEALAVPHALEEGAQGLLPISLFNAVYFCNSEGYVTFE